MGNLLICECGKEFNYSQSFNGHKRHCKIHLAAVGKLDIEQAAMNKFHQAGRERAKQLASSAAMSKQIKLDEWISEQHCCERCGKIMTEKFASGRFCSRSCANGHIHSVESKIKVAETLKKSYAEGKHKIAKLTTASIEHYLQDPNTCIICGNALPYALRKRKTCSDKCYSELHRKKTQKMYLDNKLGGRCRPSTRIKYKNVTFDSSFELALAQSLDANNIDWQQCARFKYIDPNGLNRFYRPDFYLPAYDIYLDPKNDYLINAIDKRYGYSDIDKIEFVSKQNNVKIFILTSEQLSWEYIRDNLISTK